MKKKPTKKQLAKVKHTLPQNKDSDNSGYVEDTISDCFPKEYIHTVETIVIHNCKIVPDK